jgi:hypothetical protein
MGPHGNTIYIIIDGNGMDRFYPPPILPISVRHFEKREIAGIGGVPFFLKQSCVFFVALLGLGLAASVCGCALKSHMDHACTALQYLSDG